MVDWQKEDDDDISDRANNKIDIYDSGNNFVNDNGTVVKDNFTNNNKEKHGFKEEEEWDGPFTQPDPVSPATTNRLTSSYITPVLAGYLLPSFLGLHLLPSYFQVILHDHLQLWLSDVITVIQANLNTDPWRSWPVSGSCTPSFLWMNLLGMLVLVV